MFVSIFGFLQPYTFSAFAQITATLMRLFMNCKIMMLEQNPTALKPTPIPDFFSECTDTPNYLDTWGGGCADFELPGRGGETPNENCCG